MASCSLFSWVHLNSFEMIDFLITRNNYTRSEVHALNTVEHNFALKY